jgi:hypothetical protein
MKKNGYWVGLWIIMIALSFSCANKKEAVVPFSPCTPQDIYKGDYTSTIDAQIFMNRLALKKVIFKNLAGQERVFENREGVLPDARRMNIRLNCQVGYTVDYVNFHDDLIYLEDTISHTSLRYFLFMGFPKGFDNNGVIDSSTVLEFVNFAVLGRSCAAHESFIFSDRGFPNRRTPELMKIYPYPTKTIADTTVYGKHLKDVFWVKNMDCALYDEVFFSLKEGILAYKDDNHVVWVFDRIE